MARPSTLLPFATILSFFLSVCSQTFPTADPTVEPSPQPSSEPTTTYADFYRYFYATSLTGVVPSFTGADMVTLAGDGSTLIAFGGREYVSTSWGIGWSTIYTSVSGGVVGMNYDGSIAVLGGSSNGAYLSTNRGGSWSIISASINPKTGTAPDFISASLSKSGTVIFLAGDSAYLWSSNAGASWNLVVSTTLAYSDVAVSPDGQFVILTTSSSGAPYLSTNGGATFTKINLPTTSNNVYSNPAISVTGFMSIPCSQYLTNSYGVALYTSQDNGTTWSFVSPVGFPDVSPYSLRPSSFAIAAEAPQYQIITFAAYGTQGYVSDTYGAYWTPMQYADESFKHAPTSKQYYFTAGISYDGSSLMLLDQYNWTVFVSNEEFPNFVPTNSPVPPPTVSQAVIAGSVIGTLGGVGLVAVSGYFIYLYFFAATSTVKATAGAGLTVPLNPVV